MFCPRCGAKETGDALFCRKCGAKLNDDAEPFQTEVTGRQTPPCGVELDKPQKKKSRKIPIIVGAAVLLVVVFLAALPDKQDEEPPERSEQIAAKNVSSQSPGDPLPEDDTDTDTDTASGPADAAPSDEDTGNTLLYQGIPVETIMAMQADDLIAAFGEPDYRDEYFYEYYEKGIMVSFDSMGQISTFSGKVEEYERNGKNLNQNQSGLAEIFGREPDHQETYDMTELKWYDTSCSVNIRINDDGLPCKVELWRKQTVEEAEGLLRELLVDYGQSEILYPDYVSEGFLPLNGLQVYNFNLVDSFYGLCLPVAVETDSAMLWAVPDDEETVPLSGYLTNRYEEEAVPPASGLPDGFQWVETPSGTTDEWSTTITGILQNVSDQTYDYASISFNLYDAAGNQVGTADASIQNLKAGGTWKFSAVGFAPSARFELSSVTYF